MGGEVNVPTINQPYRLPWAICPRPHPKAVSRGSMNTPRENMSPMLIATIIDAAATMIQP